MKGTYCQAGLGMLASILAVFMFDTANAQGKDILYNNKATNHLHFGC